jgi:uncharacterized membrane protein
MVFYLASMVEDQKSQNGVLDQKVSVLVETNETSESVELQNENVMNTNDNSAESIKEEYTKYSPQEKVIYVKAIVYVQCLTFGPLTHRL